MRKSMFVILVVASFLAVGCASVPTPEAMQADVAGYTLPKLPEPGKAVVYVIRPSSVGMAIRFNVFVDDKEVDSEMGFTRGSQYIYFNLMPGEHKILSKAENWAEVAVSAKENDIIFIQQNARMGVIMARNELVLPPDYEGKYQVKRLKLGTIIRADK